MTHLKRRWNKEEGKQRFKKGGGGGGGGGKLGQEGGTLKNEGLEPPYELWYLEVAEMLTFYRES